MKRKLGPSELYVNPIGFGTWPLISNSISEADAIDILLAAVDAGVDFIDTANSYCINYNNIGYCERLISKVLKRRKGSNVIVATKGGYEKKSNGEWVCNGSPKYLKKACDGSLKSLGVDCIHLYQLHHPDPKVSFLDSIGALADLKKSGKIANIGLSNASVSQVEEASKVVEIASLQNCFNPLHLTLLKKEEVFYCEQKKLTFLPYSPLGGEEEKHLIAKNIALLKIAKEYNATTFQVLLSWLLAKSSAIIPIPGSTKIKNLQINTEATKITLNSEQTLQLDREFWFKDDLKSSI